MLLSTAQLLKPPEIPIPLCFKHSTFKSQQPMNVISSQRSNVVDSSVAQSNVETIISS